jgi:hypothetical protein
LAGSTSMHHHSQDSEMPTHVNLSAFCSNAHCAACLLPAAIAHQCFRLSRFSSSCVSA